MGIALLITGALIAAGCGSDSSSKDKKKSSTTKSPKASTTAKQQVSDKGKALKAAKSAFNKKNTDVNLCRDLAMKYIAVASPESSSDPKVAPKQPKDREKNLKSSVKTLNECLKIDSKNRDVKQMLASAYMALNKYDEASPLLKEIAQSTKDAGEANAYYAWGLAAGNAQNYDDAIAAWQKFVALSPAKDARVAQVKQSIKALKLAKVQKAKPAQATPPAKSDKADTSGGNN